MASSASSFSKVLAALPNTNLGAQDWLEFNPIKVVTVADKRKQKVRNVKTLATAAVGTVAGVWLAKTLARGYEEAKEILDAHEADNS